MASNYFDMLCGDSILVSGVVHIHSPKLRDIMPSSGIGQEIYNLYLNVLSWNRDEFIKYARLLNLRGASVLAKNPDLNLFDSITLIPDLNLLILETLRFFIDETISWNNESHQIDVESNGDIVGSISRQNFEDIRIAILQLNYIGLDNQQGQQLSGSEEAKKLWNKAQEYLQKQAKEPQNKKEMYLGNIISKLCAGHNSYNLTNIFDLTIFQLYDQFFQYGYLRSTQLNEMIFSHWGGETFNIQDWLKPITNI